MKSLSFKDKSEKTDSVGGLKLKKKSAQTAQSPSNTGVKKVRKGNRVIEQSLLKLMVASGQKNVSFKFKKPSLVPYEHCHFFRDVSEKNGSQNVYCVPVGGHFHKITVDFTRAVTKEVRMPDGTTRIYENQPYTTCGPAIRKQKFFDDPSRPPSVEVLPVSFENSRGPESVDEHTHEVIYLETQEITLAGMDRLRKDSRAAIQNQMVGIGSNQAASLSKLGSASQEVRENLKEG